MSTKIITEHPGWRTTSDGGRVRLVENGGAVWLAVWNDEQGHLSVSSIEEGGAAEQPSPAFTSPVDLPAPRKAGPLLAELVRLGTVVRLNNPSLWDAVTTAILRQVVSAKQALRKHRAFYGAYGRTVATAVGDLPLVPSPETVLGLSDDGFASVGTKFNRRALRAAAEAYLDRGDYWSALGPESLMKELVGVRGIGPWTASAAAADFTGDFSVYPHGDLAVRTWAQKAAPGLELPQTEAEFEALWRRWAPARPQLHALTLFTLTWGSNDLNGRRGHPSDL
ncbi:hypothetical protein OG980_30220 [Streptomyces albidoflavus]|uniref:3-methyladenine DNA glycosylase/8-oxoguanine DNA glycosylase n=1 Tax=Streptomyces griseus TaxID=1911 RepID=A0A380PA08_STRGR|nr:hypothetical protein [Streptomyces albidoflavus]MCX4468401.1 hypothetical protein [Streptomyces albidoflavus]WSI96353.1 hypothetical protein OG695_31105 [Streptomyces albidoflavus]SUP61738.1 3-methyladenine DNA glycosylase/8-oxoguanine DNA glycosylase [Streptomyces griseus]